MDEIEWCFETGTPTVGVYKCKRKLITGCKECSFRGEKSQPFYERLILGKT